MCEAGIGERPITPEISTCLNLVQDKHKELAKHKAHGFRIANPLMKSEDVLKNMMHHIKSPLLQLHIKGEMDNKNRPLHGYRWTEEQKLAGLLKWKLSPKAYRVEAQMITMPSTRTLSRMLKDIPSEDGLNQSVLQAMKAAACEFEPHQKFVNLMFDEMAIKKRLLYRSGAPCVYGFSNYGDSEELGLVADHALVFMVRGLATDFKEPVACFYTSSQRGIDPSRRLSHMIASVIKAVNETGRIVQTTVCDQAPSNRGAYAILKKNSPGVPDCCTYFVIDNKKVHYLYDAPHVIKCWRNNFMGGWENWLRKTEQVTKIVSKMDYPGDSMSWGEGQHIITAK